MIFYIKGQITFKSPTYLLVEAAGIGYQVFISLYTYARVEKLEQVKILTFHHVKEDGQTLYGFSDEQERSLFVHLISVSGVGPSTAQLMLSYMSPEEARIAIIGEDVAALNKIKGVGPKTAKRIILDLKDRLLRDGGTESGAVQSVSPADNTHRQEALSALVALGFNRVQVQKALNKVLQENPTVSVVEDLIKLALRQLG
jgi:Holliday junction DNA helicase RuvA